jgi:hypothetical protein
MRTIIYLMTGGGDVLVLDEEAFSITELRPKALPSWASGQINFGASTSN